MLKSAAAAKALDVHPNTLRQWAQDGHIKFTVTPGGHRRYDVGSTSTPAIETPTAATLHTTQAKIIYCRVSSAKQKADLARQVEFMRNKYPGFEVIQDVGSGLNYKRRGFARLLGRVMRHEVSTIAIAERDRLCRFGFDLCSLICDTFGTTIIVDRAPVDKAPSQDMVDDVMSILHVFSAKMCGKRRYAVLEEASVQGKQETSKRQRKTPGIANPEPDGGGRIGSSTGGQTGKKSRCPEENDIVADNARHHPANASNLSPQIKCSQNASGVGEDRGNIDQQTKKTSANESSQSGDIGRQTGKTSANEIEHQGKVVPEVANKSQEQKDNKSTNTRGCNQVMVPAC